MHITSHFAPDGLVVRGALMSPGEMLTDICAQISRIGELSRRGGKSSNNNRFVTRVCDPHKAM
jgi:hypothetical protein